MNFLHIGGQKNSDWLDVASLLRLRRNPASQGFRLKRSKATADFLTWLDSGSKTDIMVMGFDNPARVVARAIAREEPPEDALHQWGHEASAILAAIEANPAKYILFNVSAAAEDPEAVALELSARTGFEIAASKPKERPSGELVYLDLAERILRGAPEISELLVELEASALISARVEPVLTDRSIKSSIEGYLTARSETARLLNALGEGAKASNADAVGALARSLRKQKLGARQAQAEQLATLLEQFSTALGDADGRAELEASLAEKSEALDAAGADIERLKAELNAEKARADAAEAAQAEAASALSGARGEIETLTVRMREMRELDAEIAALRDREVELMTASSISKEAFSLVLADVEFYQEAAQAYREALDLALADLAITEKLAAAAPARKKKTAPVAPKPAEAPAEPSDAPVTEDGEAHDPTGRGWFLTMRDYWLIRHSRLFDGEWYLERYPDLKGKVRDPAMHYLTHGGQEGRAAGPYFCSLHYMNYYPDVRTSGLNPLVHYIRSGQREGRLTFPAMKEAVE